MNIITFIIFGLIMSMTFGGFFALILISGMKESFSRVVVLIILALFLGFGLVFCIVKQSEHEEKKWNKGICTECGTEWHLQSATKYNNISTTYYYVCDNGHILKTESLFQKK